MRLTLRTLLAHLDHALEADDDAAIAAKLRESEFAAELAKRITACMQSDQLAAPSPLSTSTADDANRVGEYLDSVLAPEQIAEIERLCLESNPHLAEVAGCHQILTIVLSNPAEVPPNLRTRIYELEKQQAAQASATSNGTIAATRPHRPAGGVTTGDQATKPAAVGLDDSGVSAAATRLRSTAQDAIEVPKFAGGGLTNEPYLPATASRMNANDLTSGSSPIVPWLVSLALVASFLFVAYQAFSPLLRNRSVAVRDAADSQTIDPSNVDTSISDGEDRQVVSPGDELREKILEVEAELSSPMVEVDPAQSSVTELRALKPEPSQPSRVAPPASSETVTAETAEEMPVAPSPPSVASAASTPAILDADTTEPKPPPIKPMVAPEKDPVEDVAVVAEVAKSNSTLVSDNSLFLVKRPNEDAFVLAKKGEPIPYGSELICPPQYRDRLSIDNAFDLTMIGPAKLRLDVSENAVPVLTPLIGRFLLSPRNPADLAPGVADIKADNTATREKVLLFSFGESMHQLIFNGSDTLAAMDIIHRRAPGADPEMEGTSTQRFELLAVAGSLRWETEGAKTVELKTEEFMSWAADAEFVKATFRGVPEWIESREEKTGSIATYARDGLLGLVRGNESIELSLREAVDFRRAEVGALAAETLVLLDRPGVCFGADGTFSDPRQKSFWENHFRALVASIDRGPEAAAIVRDAINQMDAAEAAAIYRMLWLFSNEQLESGSDELLVASLDSSNMTVRVLAAENLRVITGSTLLFKPENETAPRRSNDIKKWETRLRKGDIRWPIIDAAAQPAAAPPVK